MVDNKNICQKKFVVTLGGSMFPIGSKVKVISSSITKAIGPRIGSEGYISNSSNALYCSENSDFIVSMADIVFSNYGFEKNKSHRNEFKKVFLVFPISPISYKNSTNMAERAIKKNINLFKSEKYTDTLWEYIHATLHNVGHKIPFIVAASSKPNDQTNLLDSYEEFKSWIHSVSRSNYFNLYVNIITSDPSYLEAIKSGTNNYYWIPGVSVNNIRSYKAMLNDKEYFNGLVNNAFRKEEHREPAIYDFRKITSMFYRKEMFDVIERLNDSINVGTYYRGLSFLSLYTTGMFNVGVLKPRYDIINNHRVQSQKSYDYPEIEHSVSISRNIRIMKRVLALESNKID